MSTYEKLTELIIDRLGVSLEDITMTANFKDDLGADSLDVVELIMELEDEFNVEISDEVTEKLVTVGDVVKYLDNNR